MKRRLLALLACVIPTFLLGCFWRLAIFASYYQSLDVYRDDIVIPFGILSMLIQALVWSVVYERMFAGKSIAKAKRRALPASSQFRQQLSFWAICVIQQSGRPDTVRTVLPRCSLIANRDY